MLHVTPVSLLKDGVAHVFQTSRSCTELLHITGAGKFKCSQCRISRCLSTQDESSAKIMPNNEFR